MRFIYIIGFIFFSFLTMLIEKDFSAAMIIFAISILGVILTDCTNKIVNAILYANDETEDVDAEELDSPKN